MHGCRMADLEWDASNHCCKESSRLRTALAADPDHHATWLYAHLMHQFIGIFTMPHLTPAEVTRRASEVISLLGYWDALIQRDAHASSSLNIITPQTRKDMIIACNQVILALSAMRRTCEQAGVSEALREGAQGGGFWLGSMTALAWVACECYGLGGLGPTRFGAHDGAAGTCMAVSSPLSPPLAPACYAHRAFTASTRPGSRPGVPSTSSSLSGALTAHQPPLACSTPSTACPSRWRSR